VHEDEVADVLRRQLQDDRRRSVLLGRQDKNVVDEQVGEEVGRGRDVSVLLSRLEDWLDDVVVDSGAKISSRGCSGYIKAKDPD